MPSKGNWNAGGFGFVVAHLVDKLSNLQIYKSKDRRREERGREAWKAGEVRRTRGRPPSAPISRSCEKHWKTLFLFSLRARFLSIISQLFMICLANGSQQKKKGTHNFSHFTHFALVCFCVNEPIPANPICSVPKSTNATTSIVVHL